MGNSEVLLREALTGAEEVAGAEVEIIRLADVSIKPCRGCEVCMMTRVRTGAMGSCVIKDDHLSFLAEKLAECDGLILSAPAYFSRPPGPLLMLHDRMWGFGQIYFEKVSEKPKAAAIIAVGGSDNVGLMLPVTKLNLPIGFTLIDQMMVIWTSRPAQVVLNEEAIERARRVGRKIGQAIASGDAGYRGEGAGQTGDDSQVRPQIARFYEACPLCHTDLLRVRGSFVECPFCYGKGSVEMVDGAIRFVFYDEELQTPHFGPAGTKRHDDGLWQNQLLVDEKKQEIKEKLRKYEAYKSCTVPPASGRDRMSEKEEG
jgi:multimeric flavodoxin WrbA